MPQLSSIQDVALDVVDYLYFYDVVSLASFDLEGENKAIILHLSKIITDLTETRQFHGEMASRYKHFLLCGIEIFATYNLEREVISDYALHEGDRLEFVRSLHENAIDILISKVDLNGFCIGLYRADLEDILDQTQIVEKPNYIVCNLVAKSLSFDYEGPIAAHVYRNLLDLKILHTNKDSNKNGYDIFEHEDVFLRAMLFIEFEIMRNKLFHKTDQPNLLIKYDHKEMSDRRKEKEQAYVIKTLKFVRSAVNIEFSSIFTYDLHDKNNVENYLINLGDHLCYNRMFSDNNSRWASLFGLWYFKYFEIQDPNATIYYGLNNQDTLTDRASQEVKEQFDLSIDARNIYLYLKKYEHYYSFITQGLQQFLNGPKLGFVTTCLDYYFYYHPNLSENLLDLYDSFDKNK